MARVLQPPSAQSDLARIFQNVLERKSLLTRDAVMYDGAWTHFAKTEDLKKWEDINPMSDDFDELTFRCVVCGKAKPRGHFLDYALGKWNSSEFAIFSGECYSCQVEQIKACRSHPCYTRNLVGYCQRIHASTITHGAMLGRINAITPYHIAHAYLQQNGLCKLSGVRLEFEGGKGRQNFHKASVDRIDSTVGYTPNNIQLVCWGVNKMKQDMTQTEFLTFCRLIVEKQNETENELLEALN